MTNNKETKRFPLNTQHLADAYLHAAKVNHYMIGVVADPSWDELEDARQHLIDLDNTKSTPTTRLALDWIEYAIKKL